MPLASSTHCSDYEQTYMLNNTTSFPPIAIDDVAASHAGVVEPAVILTIHGTMDRDVLVPPQPGKKVQSALCTVGRGYIVVLVDKARCFMPLAL